jgi:hypothetical protein
MASEVSLIAEEAEIAEEREVVLETSSSMSLSDDWFDALERDYEALIAEDDDGGGVNRTGKVGGSRLWKQGWGHGKEQPTKKPAGEALLT